MSPLSMIKIPSSDSLLCFFRPNVIGMVLSSLLLFLPISTFASSELSSINLQLRWFHQFQFSGYYMAQAKGFYQAEGLDVTIQEGGYGITPVQEVLKGKAQYGVGNMEILSLHQKGEPLVALAAIFQHSPSILLVRQSSDIYSAGDLKNKKIMLFPGHDDPEILAMLYQQGLTSTDFQRLDTSKNINDLISGKTDAFNAYLTNEPFFMEEKGVASRSINPRDYGIDFYSDILFTSQSELDNHPERVKAFRKASLKGWEYALEHPEEVIQLLVDTYQVKKSPDHMRYESHMVREMILPHMVDLGYMSEKRWQSIAEQLAMLELIPKDFSLKGFIYQQKKSFDWQRWGDWVFGGLLILTAFISLSIKLLYTNRRLSNEIQQRRKAEEHVRHLSLHDHLTGLPNRKLLLDRLDMACQRAQRGESHPAVIFLDLDGFKQVNDTCGHLAGDQLLCKVAESLNQQLRSTDTLARIGGDEFVILLESQLNHEQILTVADKLQRAIINLSCSCLEEPPISLSMGLAHIEPGDDATSILKKSDQAMYHVKSNGKQGIADYKDISATSSI